MQHNAMPVIIAVHPQCAKPAKQWPREREAVLLSGLCLALLALQLRGTAA
jgi:hypothetical protein